VDVTIRPYNIINPIHFITDKETIKTWVTLIVYMKWNRQS
jgi:hypothetical protein